jgi:hypothetical protein
MAKLVSKEGKVPDWSRIRVLARSTLSDIELVTTFSGETNWIHAYAWRLGLAGALVHWMRTANAANHHTALRPLTKWTTKEITAIINRR